MKKHFSKNYGYYHSPIGWIRIVANEQLISLSFIDNISDEQWDLKKVFDNVVVSNCIDQLKQYFEKKLQKFNLPLIIKGTLFQELVWSETFKIPYGSTITYQQLAKRINKPKAIRAVGSALAKNPLAIIIPCHRVVRKNNSNIINYYWGRERKIFLQELENPIK
ncbi:MAG: methylated-DNA--[protein]-cysteine S-methyltransferase [Spiroplasma sp.]